MKKKTKIKSKALGMKGISRIDSDTTHGWFVRGYRNGKTFSKLFSDLKIGGKGKALLAAKKHRDLLHKQLARIPVQSKARSTTKKGNFGSSLSLLVRKQGRKKAVRITLGNRTKGIKRSHGRVRQAA